MYPFGKVTRVSGFVSSAILSITNGVLSRSYQSLTVV